jgi:hypothetical protein
MKANINWYLLQVRGIAFHLWDYWDGFVNGFEYISMRGILQEKENHFIYNATNTSNDIVTYYYDNYTQILCTNTDMFHFMHMRPNYTGAKFGIIESLENLL